MSAIRAERSAPMARAVFKFQQPVRYAIYLVTHRRDCGDDRERQDTVRDGWLKNAGLKRSAGAGVAI